MVKMKKIRLGINGFGRIGRTVFQAYWEKYRDEIEVAAINTSGSMPIEGWAHILKYDSVYGRFPAKVSVKEAEKGKEIGRFLVGGKETPVLAERDPKRIPWKNYKVDIVLECTGVFNDRSAENHFRSGVKKVIISAPPKDDSIPIFITGVNQNSYKGQNLVSNGSCTTNCVAPIVKLIDQTLGFEECFMTTIHAYTADQNIVDGSHRDLRRARAAAINIVPTGTGAAKAVEAAYPEVAGRFAASAVRVPVVCGSYADFIFKLKEKTTVDEVNKILMEAAAGNLAGVVKVSYEPLVSSDIIGNSASAVVDTLLTEVVSDDMVKIVAWYDNEYGYSCRLLELAIFVFGK